MTSRKRLLLLVVTLFCCAFVFAITQIDLTTQVKGILAIANGGTGTSSTLTGLVRGSATAMTAAELSGDATTSGSNVVTVAKINGTTVPTTSTLHQILVTTGSAAGTWKTIPDCVSGALNYTQSSDVVGCGTVLTGSFADSEVPSGAIDGSNAAFVMAHTPSPAGSLSLYKNGQLMIAGGADYTLATATATFVTAAKPKTGDAVVANYRW